MARELLPDALWAEIEPLLPRHDPSPSMDGGGRPRIPDRAAPTGILFVLTYNIPWSELPKVLGFGSGRTCHRRLDEWQRAGIWDALHQRLLAHLQRAGEIDWSRASVDAGGVPSPMGGEDTGPNPTDRGKLGTKHHVLVDRRG